MEMIPWGRAPGFPALREEMNRIFGDLFADWPAVRWEGNGQWMPALNLVESADSVVVTAEIPGVDAKDVQVAVEDHYLTLRGEKKEEREEKGKAFHRVERRYGSFARAVLLPCAVDAAKVTAEAKDGVLTVTLPKAAEAKARTVPVQAKKG
jgi:HSP20 family protein